MHGIRRLGRSKSGDVTICYRPFVCVKKIAVEKAMMVRTEHNDIVEASGSSFCYGEDMRELDKSLVATQDAFIAKVAKPPITADATAKRIFEPIVINPLLDAIFQSVGLRAPAVAEDVSVSILMKTAWYALYICAAVIALFFKPVYPVKIGALFRAEFAFAPFQFGGFYVERLRALLACPGYTNSLEFVSTRFAAEPSMRIAWSDREAIFALLANELYALTLVISHRVLSYRNRGQGQCLRCNAGIAPLISYQSASTKVALA